LKHLLFFLSLFSPSLFAQTVLNAGTWTNLKMTDPLVLDTGVFVFEGLEFGTRPPNLPMLNRDKLQRGNSIEAPPLGAGGLDARKARSVTFSHCEFNGAPGQSGILLQGDATIHHCRFRNLDTALSMAGQGFQTLVLYRNLFENNRTAISLRRQRSDRPFRLAFSLKCNGFVVTDTVQKRTGLLLGKGLELGYLSAGVFMHQKMGSEHRNFYDAFEYPNGNLWPSLTDADQAGWLPGLPADPQIPGQIWRNQPRWVAIDNQTGSPVVYTRYESEFVGWGPALKGEVDFRKPDGYRKLRLDRETVTDTCVYKTQQPKGSALARVCEQLVDEQPFLLPTHFSELRLPPPRDKSQPQIDSRITRPENTLRIWIPAWADRAVLQYLDSDGKTVLQTNPIAGRGWVSAYLDLLTPGIDSVQYRLVVNGQPGIIHPINPKP